jgi:phthalate 4,5-cis-dihydrodiol dehydrogenase
MSIDSPPRTLRIGLAGLGVASTQVLPPMEAFKGIQIAAAADMRPEALEAFEERYGGQGYSSVEALAEDPSVEAVWVSTPNQFHCDHVVTLVEHGKHVVVEKPMALSIEECERMVAAAERNQVQLLCGHTQSFNPAIRAMRQIVQSGELGSLAAVHTWMSTDWMLRPRMPQELDLSLGGGVVYRQGPHQIDIVRLIGGGMVRSVRARTGQLMPERSAPGNYMAFLEFEDGTPATVIYNGYGYFDTSEFVGGYGERHYSPEDRVTVRRQIREQARDDAKAKEAMRFGGQREGDFSQGSTQGVRRERLPGGGSFFGITVVTCERGEIRQTPPDSLLVYSDSGIKQVEVTGQHASRNSELQELYDAVVEGRPVYHNGRWGMATLEVCLGIMQSARERREVMMSHQSPTDRE